MTVPTKVQVTIRSAADRSKVARWASQTGDGTVVEFKRPTRSVEQNALFHAMLADVARTGPKWFGKRRTFDEWKTLVISGHAMATGRSAEVVPGIEGELVAIRESSAQMSVERVTSLIEYLYAFGAEHGVTFTDPGAAPASGTKSAVSIPPIGMADASLEGVR